MTESKRNYQSPRMKVMNVRQVQIICASAYGTQSMYEEDLDGISSEQGRYWRTA